MTKSKSPVEPEDFKGGHPPELTVVLQVLLESSMHQREQKRIVVVVHNMRTYPVWVPASHHDGRCTKIEQLIAEG